MAPLAHLYLAPKSGQNLRAQTRGRRRRRYLALVVAGLLLAATAIVAPLTRPPLLLKLPTL